MGSILSPLLLDPFQQLGTDKYMKLTNVNLKLALWEITNLLNIPFVITCFYILKQDQEISVSSDIYQI